MFFVALAHKQRQVVWVADLGPQRRVCDQFRTEVPLVVGVLQFDDVPCAHHVLHLFEGALQHNRELDVLGFVHHGVADEQVGEFTDLPLHKGFRVAVFAHREPVLGVAAHFIHIVAADVDFPVCDFILQDG